MDPEGPAATGAAPGRAGTCASPSPLPASDRDVPACAAGARRAAGTGLLPMGAGTGEAPSPPASAAGRAPPSGTEASFVPAARRREALFTTGPGSEAGTDEEPITERASAGAGSGKEATGAVTAERAAVWGDGASSSRGVGKSSQSSSPGSTTSPPPDDDRPYSAARRSASAASSAASMGRAGACCASCATVGTASAAGADEIPAVFLRPRPTEVDGRPAREAFFRPALDEGCSSPRTDAATEGFPRADSATGAVPCSPASRGEDAPLSGTAAVFVPAARRRRADVFFGGTTGPGGVAAAGAAPSDGTTGGTSGTLPVAKASDASSSGRFPASVRELLPDGGVFFRLVFRLREDAGSAACFFSRSSAGAFPAGAASCAAFCPFPAVFSDRDGSRPQASSNERAVAVMTVTRLRDNRLLVSSPAAGDRSGAASEGEDMELLDYIQIG